MRATDKLLIATVVVVGLLLGAVRLTDYLVDSHPLLARALVGEARILSPQLNAEVKVNGIINREIRCYPMTTDFDGGTTDCIVVWIPNNRDPLKRDIIIVDRVLRNVGMPNAREDDYRWYGNWLFQSRSGSQPVFFTEPKSCGENPQLRSRAGFVSFRMPKAFPSLPGSSIEIRMPAPLTNSAAGTRGAMP